MKCQNCGAEVNSKLCTKCGQQIPEQGQQSVEQQPTAYSQQPMPAYSYGQTPKKKGLKWWHILLIVLGSIFVLSVVAGIWENSTKPGTETVQSTVAPTTSGPATSEPAVKEGVGNIGDYRIEIVSAEKGKDYSERDVLIVTYKWTNNSDTEQMFSTAFSAKAYQDGIECSSLTIVNGVDDGKSLSNIKPGASLEVQKAYLLNGDTDVVIEVRPWISWNNEEKVVKIFSLK